MTHNRTLARGLSVAALAALVALLAVGVARAQSVAEAPNYGTAAVTYEQVPGIAFTPFTSGQGYSFSAVNTGQGLRTGALPAA